MSSNLRRPLMKRVFKLGDHVTWNSEAGHVSGTIIKVHTKNVNYKGYTHHASEAEPQYEIKSDKTDHIALHKGSADRKSTRLNSSHLVISYAVFCLKKKKKQGEDKTH